MALWIEKNTAPLVAANRLATKLSFPAADFTQFYLEDLAQSNINGKKSLPVDGGVRTIQTDKRTGLEACSIAAAGV